MRDRDCPTHKNSIAVRDLQRGIWRCLVQAKSPNLVYPLHRKGPDSRLYLDTSFINGSAGGAMIIPKIKKRG